MAEPSILTTMAHIYFVAGILYNVASQLWGDVFGKKFAATEPMTGVLMVSSVYTIYLLQEQLPAAPRLFMLTVYLLFIARFGILQHFLHYEAENYLSRATWALAMLINIFGVIVVGAHLVLSYGS